MMFLSFYAEYRKSYRRDEDVSIRWFDIFMDACFILCHVCDDAYCEHCWPLLIGPISPQSECPLTPSTRRHQTYPRLPKTTRPLAIHHRLPAIGRRPGFGRWSGEGKPVASMRWARFEKKMGRADGEGAGVEGDGKIG